MKELIITERSNLVTVANAVRSRTGETENMTLNEMVYGVGGIGSDIDIDTTLTQEGQAADAKAVGEALAQKQDAITGNAGQFVVIGNDGKPTTKTIPYAEEATF